MGVIDSIQIPGGPLVQHTAGAEPLEYGEYNPPGTWVPDTAETPVYFDGFGVAAATGSVYFDTVRATPGENAVLWVNANTGRVGLLA